MEVRYEIMEIGKQKVRMFAHHLGVGMCKSAEYRQLSTSEIKYYATEIPLV